MKSKQKTIFSLIVFMLALLFTTVTFVQAATISITPESSKIEIGEILRHCCQTPF